MSFNHHLSELAISQSGFVFDPHTGATFTLNFMGLTLVEALKAGVPPERLAARVHEDYAEVPADVEHDIASFLSELRQQGLLGSDDASLRGGA